MLLLPCAQEAKGFYFMSDFSAPGQSPFHVKRRLEKKNPIVKINKLLFQVFFIYLSIRIGIAGNGSFKVSSYEKYSAGAF